MLLKWVWSVGVTICCRFGHSEDLNYKDWMSGCGFTNGLYGCGLRNVFVGVDLGTLLVSVNLTTPPQPPGPILFPG